MSSDSTRSFSRIPPGPFLKLVICLALSLGTLALYAPTRHYEFLNYDDNDYVTDNPRVLGGFTSDNVISAFTRFHASNWHPVTWLSHMLDVELWGKNAGGHHITNVLFHTANAVLLFLVFTNMTGTLWRSAFVAAVFAWHPAHVESVAWISERKDLLSTFFWILSMAAYLYYVRRGKAYRYLLVVVIFILALMSKPMVVTFPLVLLLLDYWPLHRATLTKGDMLKWFNLFLEKTPLLLCAVIVARITISTQNRAGSLKSIVEIPWPLRLSNVPIAYISYLSEAVWPVKLAVLYPLPAAISLSRAVSAALALLLITALVIGATRNAPYLPVGWLWFLGTLVPVIGFVQVGSQSMADRYTYLPLIGLTVAFAWGGWEILKKMERGWELATVLVVLSTVLMAQATTKQLPYWQNSVTLFQRALSVTSNNGIAEGNLSSALLSKNQDTEAAVKHAREAIRLLPNHPAGYLNLGMASLRQQRIFQAIPELEKAVQLQPNWPDAHLDLGGALLSVGRIDEGIAHLYEALRLDPDYVPALNALAWIRATQADASRRNAKEALRFAERAVKLTKNEDPEALDIEAAAFAEASQFDEAIKVAEQARALAIASNNPQLGREVTERLDLYRLGLPYRARR